MPEKQGSNRGGARAGAGRKRLYGRALTVTVAAAVPGPLVAKLDRWADSRGLTRSQAVAELIRRGVS